MCLESTRSSLYHAQRGHLDLDRSGLQLSWASHFSTVLLGSVLWQGAARSGDPQPMEGLCGEWLWRGYCRSDHGKRL